MLKTKSLLPAVMTSAAALAVGQASAEITSNLSVIDFSSQFGTGQAADNAANGSGLDTTDPDPLNWTHTEEPGGSATHWHSLEVLGDPDLEYITFDLKGIYNLDAALIWNFNVALNGETDRGFNQYDLLVAPNGVDPTDFTSFAPAITDGFLNQASGTPLETAQVVPLTGLANNVRYVRLEADSNFGGVVTGLSEARFDGMLVTALENPTIAGVSVADVSSEYNGNLLAVNTINGNGLSQVGDDPRQWTHDNGSGGTTNHWHSLEVLGDPDVEYITYDLGAVYDLEEVLVWNFNVELNGENDRGVQQYDLLVAPSGADPTDPSSFSAIITDGLLDQASATADETAQVIDVTGLADGVRFVRIDIDSNFGGVVTGLSEVRFTGTLAGGSLVGDTDGDGDIDDFDLLNAISNFTGSLAAGTGGKGISEGDTDADADVDDFDLLSMISGFTGSLSAPQVPEPASLSLLALGGLLVTRRRRSA